MLFTFMAFCEFVGKDILSMGANTIPMFIEFLIYNGLKHASFLNFISAIKSQLKWFEIPHPAFDHLKVRLILEAVSVSRNPPKFKSIFDISSLTEIIKSCDLLSHPLVFYTIYLFSIFWFP